MMKRVKNNKAQALMGEYGTLILLVVAAMIAMTVYFKRAVQARIRDANTYMVNEVAARTGRNFVGSLRYEYEPYYTESDSTVSSSTDQNAALSGGASTGIFNKNISNTRTIDAASETLPPKDAQ